VLPLTAEEHKRFNEALLRRQLRLLQAGRLKPEEAPELREWFFKQNN